MQVLVLGGTGAMGKSLVHLLAEKKDVEVTVTSRTVHPNKENIQYVQGDARDIQFLTYLLQKHYDCIVDFMVYTTIEFKQRVNLFLNSTSQYVYLSSSRVYANQEYPITELSSRLSDSSKDKLYLATDEYALAKARQEDILYTSVYKNWTIIRPYITYSETRLQLGTLEKEDWLYRALNRKTIVFCKEMLEKTTTLTYGLDVASGITALIGNKKVLGEVFHITGNKSMIWGEILDIYLNTLENYLGNRPKVLLLNLEDFLKIKPPMGKYQILYDRLFNRCFDNSKIAKYVDINNFTSIEEGLSMCLETFLKKPCYGSIDWRKQANMDRICNERTLLHKINGTKQKLKYLLCRHGVIK
jgi:nucleoside-diphosphate-sugar epimerase